MYPEKIIVYPNISFTLAERLLKAYIDECNNAPRKLGYGGMVLYGLTDNTSYCVYRTKTAYIIRRND